MQIHPDILRRPLKMILLRVLRPSGQTRCSILGFLCSSHLVRPATTILCAGQRVTPSPPRPRLCQGPSRQRC